MLRDRLVVGCREATIQRKLLGDTSLTFEKAVNIATAMEMASRDVEKIEEISQPESQSASSQVNKMQPQRSQKQKFASKSPGASQSKRQLEENAKPARRSYTQQKCWRCGAAHAHDTCSFKTEKCYKCRRMGYTKSQCDKVQEFNRHYQRKTQRAHHLEDEESLENEPAILSHIKAPAVRLLKCKPYYVTMDINGKKINMEVDTGSPWSIVSYKTFTEIGNPDELQPCNPRLTTYTGDRVPLIGEASVHVKHLSSQQMKSLPLLVVQDGVNLMGREWIENFPSSLANVL